MRRRVVVVIFAALIVASIVSSPGCAGWEATLDEQRERLVEARQTATPEQQQRIDELLAALEAARAKLRRVESSPVREISSTIAPFLPPPWNEVVVVGGGLLALVLRSIALKRAAKSIASSIEAAPNIPASAFDADRPILDAIQTPTAKRIVDAVQGKNTIERYLPL